MIKQELFRRGSVSFFKPDSIKAVATDSHRLSQRIIALENGPQSETHLIIPGKSFKN